VAQPCGGGAIVAPMSKSNPAVLLCEFLRGGNTGSRATSSISFLCFNLFHEVAKPFILEAVVCNSIEDIKNTILCRMQFAFCC
jgi:hypothetical protein